MAWRALVVGLEAATAACAGLNLAYFLYRMTAHYGRPSRRLAAFLLALVSLGVMGESVFVLRSLMSGDGVSFAAGEWAAVRLVVFIGMASIAALVLRRIGEG